MERSEVYELIDTEREYQLRKWGHKKQDIPGYLLILRSELDEAIDGWMKNRVGRNGPANELLQVAAVAVAALEEHGHKVYDEDYDALGT